MALLYGSSSTVADANHTSHPCPPTFSYPLLTRGNDARQRRLVHLRLSQGSLRGGRLAPLSQNLLLSCRELRYSRKPIGTSMVWASFAGQKQTADSVVVASRYCSKSSFAFSFPAYPFLGNLFAYMAAIAAIAHIYAALPRLDVPVD